MKLGVSLYMPGFLTLELNHGESVQPTNSICVSRGLVAIRFDIKIAMLTITRLCRFVSALEIALDNA